MPELFDYLHFNYPKKALFIRQRLNYIFDTCKALKAFFKGARGMEKVGSHTDYLYYTE